MIVTKFYTLEQWHIIIMVTENQHFLSSWPNTGLIEQVLDIIALRDLYQEQKTCHDTM